MIGTFWHADELACLLLLSRFYNLWTKEHLPPAEALGQAQEWLMTTTAEKLINSLDTEVLGTAPGLRLIAMPLDAKPYAHPWFWAGFFFAGA